MGQIREQAAQIKQLEEQLEIAKAQASAASPPSDIASVAELKPTQLENDVAGPSRNQADVQDWVAKARESVEASGGYIAPTYRNSVEESDSDDSDSYGEADRDSEYSEQGDRFDEAPSNHDSPEDGNKDGGKRKDTEKLATVPSPVTPVGLMANLSLRRSRLTKGANTEVENDGVGMARDDYFKAGKFGASPSMTWSFNPAPATLDPNQRLADPEQHQHPHILTRGVVIPQEVDILFEMYVWY